MINLNNFDQIIRIDPGDTVLCDICNLDYTARPDSGGLLFQSKAVCPKCAPDFELSAQRCGELHFIRARCPMGKSFADWVREDLR